MRLEARYLIARRGETHVGFRLDELSEVGRLPGAILGRESGPGRVLQLHGVATPMVDLGDLPGVGGGSSERPGWFVATRHAASACIAIDGVEGIRLAREQTAGVPEEGPVSGFLELEGRSVPVVSSALLSSLAEGRKVPGVGRTPSLDD